MKIEELMNRYYSTFSENDKYIAQCILAHKQDCVHLPIETLAKRYHVSKSALSRFSQKLHLPGYSELRSYIRLHEMQTHDASSSFLEVAIHNYHAMIEDLRKKDFSILFQTFDQAKRILIFASGYSQARVASEFKRMFFPVNKIIYDMYGHDMCEAFLHMVNEDDVVILISLTGENEDVVSIAKEVRLRGVSLVSITRMKMNTLTQLCDENLYIHSIEVPAYYHVQYEISTPYFILIEILFLEYQKHLEREHNFND